MKTIYFVRHGQSQANVDGVYAGQSDSPLTQKGKEQAQSAGDMAKKLKIEKIFSSDLQRAYDTACIIADNLDIDHEKIERTAILREVNVGKLAGKPERGRKGTIHEDLPGFSYYYKIKNNEMGVEYIGEIKDRLYELIEILKQQPEETILIVSHDIIGLILRQILEGRKGDIFKDKSFANGEVAEIIWREQV